MPSAFSSGGVRTSVEGAVHIRPKSQRSGGRAIGAEPHRQNRHYLSYRQTPPGFSTRHAPCCPVATLSGNTDITHLSPFEKSIKTNTGKRPHPLNKQTGRTSRFGRNGVNRIRSLLRPVYPGKRSGFFLSGPFPFLSQLSHSLCLTWTAPVERSPDRCRNAN